MVAVLFTINCVCSSGFGGECNCGFHCRAIFRRAIFNRRNWNLGRNPDKMILSIERELGVMFKFIVNSHNDRS